MSLPLPTIASRVLTTTGFTFPQTVKKLEHLFLDSSAPVEAAQAVISSDPMLAGLTLSLANQTGEGVTRLNAALGGVGLGGVVGMTRGFIPVPDAASQTLAGCWQLANATAVMLRLLARRVALHLPASQVAQLEGETLSLVGLLHDLGTAVAVVRFPQEFAKAVARQEAGEHPFTHLLKQELGIEATDLGYLLARNWNLPAVFTECIRYHERPLKAELHPEIACAVHVARALVRGLGFTAGPDRFVNALDNEAVARLHLRLDDYPPLLERFLEEWETREMFEVGAR